MTPEDHNKVLGWTHIAYGAFFSLMGVAFGIFFMFIATLSEAPARGNPPPAGLFVGIGVFFTLFYCLMSVPSLFAGYALLKRKSWAKVVSLIAGALASMSFPMGTAVCVYTFWFLFSDAGKQLYDQAPSAAQKWYAQPQPGPGHWRDPAELNPPSANDWRNRTTQWETPRRAETNAPSGPPNWRT